MNIIHKRLPLDSIIIVEVRAIRVSVAIHRAANCHQCSLGSNREPYQLGALPRQDAGWHGSVGPRFAGHDAHVDGYETCAIAGCIDVLVVG